jgi:uncharacterized protein YgiM (DUF1202 family)
MYKSALSCLLVLMLCLSPLAVLAGEMGTVHTNRGGNLNLRAAPSDTAAVLASYPSGKWVEVLEAGKTWYKVSVDGLTGYMAARYVSLGNVTVVTDAKVSGAAGYINLRQSASYSAAVLATCPNGTRVKFLGSSNGFYKVQVGELVGYMAQSLVRLDDAKTQTYAYVRTNNGGNLNLRSTPNLAGQVLASFASGTQVAVLQKDGSWSKVKVQGATGYMASQYLSAKQGGATATGTATLFNPNGTGIVNFRSSPKLSGSNIITTYKVGTRVTVLDRGVDWSYVQIGEALGYVSSWFLK